METVPKTSLETRDGFPDALVMLIDRNQIVKLDVLNEDLR